MALYHQSPCACAYVHERQEADANAKPSAREIQPSKLKLSKDMEKLRRSMLANHKTLHDAWVAMPKNEMGVLGKTQFTEVLSSLDLQFSEAVEKRLFRELGRPISGLISEAALYRNLEGAEPPREHYHQRIVEVCRSADLFVRTPASARVPRWTGRMPPYFSSACLLRTSAVAPNHSQVPTV
eukprot:GHVU01086410.1.p1 GENE.GHVU01086410.1~~GHVU01086410.1.p1  ORF type:complete len:182 (-),score=13.41 GHVU01086410.1:91-636(-)